MESAWSQLLEATSQLLLEFLSANICIYIYKQHIKTILVDVKANVSFIHRSLGGLAELLTEIRTAN